MGAVVARNQRRGSASNGGGGALKRPHSVDASSSSESWTSGSDSGVDVNLYKKNQILISAVFIDK